VGPKINPAIGSREYQVYRKIKYLIINNNTLIGAWKSKVQRKTILHGGTQNKTYIYLNNKNQLGH